MRPSSPLPLLVCIVLLLLLSSCPPLAHADDHSCACQDATDKLPRMVMPRERAPDFDVHAVVNDTFARVSLADYRGRWLVLWFFPFAFTFVCPTEIIAFSDRMAEFEALGASVAAMSTDSHHTLLAWARTPPELGGLGTRLALPLLADVSKRASAAYGVLVHNEDDPLYGAALRGLFIIDPEGVVKHAHVNDDEVGRSVDETLRLVQAFQHAASHDGEVCPANWQPGGATIVANPDGAKQYFKEQFQANAATTAQQDFSTFKVEGVGADSALRTVCLELGMRAIVPELAADITPAQLRIKQIGGGITNKLVKCDYTAAGEDGATHTVLVRLFGENTELLIDREREAQVMRELTDNGFGCRLLGIFANGRVESFLPGRALETEEVRLPHYRQQVAKEMARMHKLQLSGDRSPVVWRTLTRWLELARGVSFEDADSQAMLKQLDVEKLAAEVAWMQAAAEQLPSPVVMCHNDMLSANLITDNGIITVIDFEYSDWNHRGFDIANHFNEWAGFECEWASKPSADVETEFLTTYVKQLTPNAADADVEREVAALAKEVQLHSLTSHLFWGIWGILQEAYSSIPFDYLPYAVRRMERYYLEKTAVHEVLQ